MKNIIIALLVCFIPISVLAEDKCNSTSLEKLRNKEFAQKIKAGKFTEAASVLSDYLDKADCASALISEASNKARNGIKLSTEEKANIRSYLWAWNDVALANLKGGRFGECISITSKTINKYHNNPLELLGDKKLIEAYQYNLKSCEAKRETTHVEQKNSADCAEMLKGVLVEKYFPSTRDGYSVRLPIKKLVASFEMGMNSGYSCIAMVRLQIPVGLYDGLCKSIKECEASPEVSDNKPVDTALLVGLKPENPKIVTEIFEENYQCGDFILSKHLDQAEQEVFRFKGGFFPCMGGTARGYVDEFFSLRSGKYEVLESASRVYH
jgi:hypothetical protein